MVSQVNVLRLRTAGDTSIAYLYVNTSGKLALRNESPQRRSPARQPSASGWHALEFHAVINGTASLNRGLAGRDQVGALSITTNLGTTPIGRVQIGEAQSARVYNVVFDDVVFDTQPIGL